MKMAEWWISGRTVFPERIAHVSSKSVSQMADSQLWRFAVSPMSTSILMSHGKETGKWLTHGERFSDCIRFSIPSLHVQANQRQQCRNQRFEIRNRCSLLRHQQYEQSDDSCS